MPHVIVNIPTLSYCICRLSSSIRVHYLSLSNNIRTFCFRLLFSCCHTMHLTDPSNKVLIFDWDDTICPSTFVDNHQIDNISGLPTDVQELFSEIAKCAEKCLKEASKYGEVIIITNSDEGWVKYSAEKFVPRLLPVVDNYRIISARTRYEKFYPNQPLCWKAAAFAHEVNELYETSSAVSDNASAESYDSLEATDISSASEDSFAPNPASSVPSLKREVISFGDSMEERTAVRIVSDQFNAVPKSVMFLPSPTPIHIIGQLLMLADHMKYVCEHETSLDLEISLEQAEMCASRYIERHDIDLDSNFPGAVARIEEHEQTPNEVVVTAVL